MKIDAIEMREVNMPLAHPFETSFGVTTGRRILLVELRGEGLSAWGECVAGEILEIGNTNSRYRFPLGARGFVNAWNAQAPAHHCAVGVGHVAAVLEKCAALMGIGFHRVC